MASLLSKAVFPVVVLLLLQPAAAAAGTIQMSIATRIVAGEAGLRVEIDLHNSGDEPALNVVPSVEFQGRVIAGAAIDTLAPSSLRTVAIEVPYAGPVQPRGRWPVLVRVAHADGAGRPFEAIHVDIARFGGGGDTPVRLEVPDVRVESEARIALRIDRADVPGPIRVAFATPVGFLVTPRVIVHEPASGSTMRVQASIVGATVGSRLPLVTIAEYDAADGHHAVAVVSMVDVVETSDAGTRVVVTSGILGLTLVTWLALAVRAARRRSRSSDVA